MPRKPALDWWESHSPCQFTACATRRIVQPSTEADRAGVPVRRFTEEDIIARALQGPAKSSRWVRSLNFRRSA